MIISDEEMKCRMRRDKTSVDPFQVFRLTNRRTILLEHVNIMEIPSIRNALDLKRFSQPNQNNNSMLSRLMSMNMKTKVMPDDNFFYLTELRTSIRSHAAEEDFQLNAKE
jgi:hypothetical protein